MVMKMKLQTRNLWLASGVLAAIFVSGCADRNKNGVPDSFAPDAGAKANKVLDSAEKTATNVGNKISAEAKPALKQAEHGAKVLEKEAKPTLDKAGHEIRAAVKNPGATAANAKAALTITPKIKAAIATTDALNGTDIDVSTVGTSKVVRLDGKVKTAGQKKLASAVAARSATGYTIEDHLVVAK